jgi:hypothetical protein
MQLLYDPRDDVFQLGGLEHAVNLWCKEGKAEDRRARLGGLKGLPGRKGANFVPWSDVYEDGVETEGGEDATMGQHSIPQRYLRGFGSAE